MCRCGFPQGSSKPGGHVDPAAARRSVPIWLSLAVAGLLALAFAAQMFVSEKSPAGTEPASRSSPTAIESTEPPREPPAMRNPVVTIVGPIGGTTENYAIEYEAAVASLARVADRVDASWERYRQDCAPYASGETFGREWFGVWSSSLEAVSQPLPECEALLAGILTPVAEVRRGMESLRGDDVDPGVRRDIRRKHRMDWTGWDRR